MGLHASMLYFSCTGKHTTYSTCRSQSTAAILCRIERLQPQLGYTSGMHGAFTVMTACISKGNAAGILMEDEPIQVHMPACHFIRHNLCCE